ncbi:MAG: ABC transporter transmembrane domain-containing protein, partial [Chloroflexota bacterium]|nr:ABC transporter transmembrane domain-containing protein [Chloroflexota bacterium]
MSRYRRLLRYAIPYRRGWALILAVTLLSTAFGLLQPWPLKILVDHVFGQQPLSEPLRRAIGALPGARTSGGQLAWVALAGLVIFAVDSALDVILTMSWIRVGQRMVYDLAGDLFANLQRRSLLFHSRNPVGDSLSRITGDSWCVHTVADTLLFKPGHALITLVGMVVVMVRLDTGLTLLALAVAPFMTGASLVFGRPIRAAAQARRVIESHLQSHVQRTLSGISVVQAFTREEEEHRRFREFTAAAIRAQQRSTVADSVYNLASGLITTLGTAGILLVGGRHVLEGTLTVGGLLVFLAYLGSLQGQLRAFTGLYGALQGASASVDRVLEVLGTAREGDDRAGAVALPPVRGHVRFEGVVAGYEPGRPVLRGVSLEARPG